MSKFKFKFKFKFKVRFRFKNKNIWHYVGINMFFSESVSIRI